MSLIFLLLCCKTQAKSPNISLASPDVWSKSPITESRKPTWSWESTSKSKKKSYQYCLLQEGSETSFPLSSSLKGREHVFAVAYQKDQTTWSNFTTSTIRKKYSSFEEVQSKKQTKDPNERRGMWGWGSSHEPKEELSLRFHSSYGAPSWTWSASARMRSKTVYRYCLLKDTNQKSYTPTQELPIGTHTLLIREADANNNISPFKQFSITIKEPPIFVGGYVFDETTKRPIANAEVIVLNPDVLIYEYFSTEDEYASAFSNKDGYWRLERSFVLDTVHAMMIKKDGYQPFEEDEVQIKPFKEPPKIYLKPQKK